MLDKLFPRIIIILSSRSGDNEVRKSLRINLSLEKLLSTETFLKIKNLTKLILIINYYVYIIIGDMFINLYFIFT